VPSVFLPAADIPRFVGEGNLDLGITGQDMVLEAEMETLTREVLKLGFGKCKLQVQVPERGPITSEADLAGKRVVTSFEVLANKHFAKIDAEANQKTRIEYVGGSVEAACALGLADGIGTSRFARRRPEADVCPNLQSIWSILEKRCARRVFMLSARS